MDILEKMYKIWGSPKFSEKVHAKLVEELSRTTTETTQDKSDENVYFELHNRLINVNGLDYIPVWYVSDEIYDAAYRFYVRFKKNIHWAIAPSSPFKLNANGWGILPYSKRAEYEIEQTLKELNEGKK